MYGVVVRNGSWHPKNTFCIVARLGSDHYVVEPLYTGADLFAVSTAEMSKWRFFTTFEDLTEELGGPVSKLLPRKVDIVPRTYYDIDR